MLTKYPRTLHLPTSPGTTKDDKKHAVTPYTNGETIVATIKYDGENTTLYKHTLHARSLDSENTRFEKLRQARSRVKALWYTIAHQIPDDVRICGENLQAKHSISYENLPAWFLVFSVWRDNVCLSWQDTQSFCQNLGLLTVPCFYEGPFNTDVVQKAYEAEAKDPYGNEREGYVVRPAGAFEQAEFSTRVAKWVRDNHVQTDTHWLHTELEENHAINVHV